MAGETEFKTGPDFDIERDGECYVPMTGTLVDEATDTKIIADNQDKSYRRFAKAHLRLQLFVKSNEWIIRIDSVWYPEFYVEALILQPNPSEDKKMVWKIVNRGSRLPRHWEIIDPYARVNVAVNDAFTTVTLTATGNKCPGFQLTATISEETKKQIRRASWSQPPCL